MNKTLYTPSYSQPLYTVDKHQEGTIVYTDNGVILQEPVKGEIVVEQAVTSGEENGHQWVDLDLPSGTKWATMNVGASSETDYGNYYMYGKGANQFNSSDQPYSGKENPLSISVDTAAQVWGGQWRMPTKEQCEELIDNTTYEWVTNYQDSGINGATFTANEQTLFIPAAGDITVMDGFLDEGTNALVRTCTPCLNNDAYAAYTFIMNRWNATVDYTSGDSWGLSVRPVINSQS